MELKNDYLMRKKIYPVLFVAALSLSACTEVLEPNVDYGGNTFINDYSSLVEAVNNLNKTLQERFDALNSLLDKNLANIKVAIDENTGAIKVLDQTTQQGLNNINTSIFDGFKTLSEQVDTQGTAIVYAINQNGEMLRLQIDSTGKLISTQIQTSANALVNAINDQTKTLEERFAALDATIKAGLLDVQLSIDKNTGAITLLDKNTQASLATIDASLTKGFTAIKQSIDEQGNAIVSAINTQGKLLVAQIKSTGEVITAQIKGSVEDLIETLNANNKTLTEKIEALNQTVGNGLADVKVSINELTGQVELQTEAITQLDGTLAAGMNDMKAGLDKINKTIGKGFAAVGKDLTKAGGMIVKAINDQTEELTFTIDKNGRLISTSINKFNIATNANLAILIGYQHSLATTLKDINENLDKLTEAEKANVETLKKILDSINSQLVTKGIYITDDKLYMTSEAWSTVSADKTSNLYKKSQEQARTVVPVLYLRGDAYKVSVKITDVVASDKDELYAVNYDKVPGIGTDAKVYEIVKMKNGVTGRNINMRGNSKDLLGFKRYKVGYAFSDVLGVHESNGYAENQSFKVTYVSGKKLTDEVRLEYYTK